VGALNLKLAVPFFMVSNMEASLKFYTEGLGFKLTKQWEPRGTIEWCWVERDGVAIMLQEPRKPTPSVEKGTGITICIQCADALSLFLEFRGKGIEVPEPFVGNNMWVFQVKDPDGYRVEFESNTEVSEETKYGDWAATIY
jgi:lactoylglutathione lyase